MTRVAIQPTKALAGETSAVSKTVDGRKVVRGFEPSPSYWNGHMDGAVRSGKRAAGEVLRA